MGGGSHRDGRFGARHDQRTRPKESTRATAACVTSSTRAVPNISKSPVGSRRLYRLVSCPSMRRRSTAIARPPLSLRTRNVAVPTAVDSNCWPSTSSCRTYCVSTARPAKRDAPVTRTIETEPSGRSWWSRPQWPPRFVSSTTRSESTPSCAFATEATGRVSMTPKSRSAEVSLMLRRRPARVSYSSPPPGTGNHPVAGTLFVLSSFRRAQYCQLVAGMTVRR